MERKALDKRSNAMDHLKNNSGFTLVEVLIAAVLIVIGLVGMAVLSGEVVQRDSLSEKSSIATTLAQEKVEDLKNQALNAALENTDSGNDTVNTIYTRTWTITNGGANNLTQVTVTVSWPTNKSVSLSTLIRQ